MPVWSLPEHRRHVRVGGCIFRDGGSGYFNAG